MEVVGELDDRSGTATFAENASADFVRAGLRREHRFFGGKSKNPPLLVGKTLNWPFGQLWPSWWRSKNLRKDRLDCGGLEADVGISARKCDMTKERPRR